MMKNKTFFYFLFLILGQFCFAQTKVEVFLASETGTHYSSAEILFFDAEGKALSPTKKITLPNAEITLPQNVRWLAVRLPNHLPVLFREKITFPSPERLVLKFSDKARVGDLNHDLKINALDLYLFNKAQWEQNLSQADFNQDGVINENDRRFIVTNNNKLAHFQFKP